MKDIAIYGAGGFGREVMTLINDINSVENNWNLLGFFDDGRATSEIVNGYPILGGMDELNQWSKPLSIIIAIGSPSAKEKIVTEINNDNVDYPSLSHPTLIIGNKNSVNIGKGCIICANNIITTESIIGNFVTLNLACTIGHDTKIGDYCSFMPASNISGEVTIDKGVYCGTGTKIINQLHIGQWATIGAGAVVIRDVPDGAVVAGVPAKAIK